MNIAVIHDTPNKQGGGEQVFMNILEALSSDHNVVSIVGEETSIERLNQYFGTNVDDVEVVVPSLGPISISRFDEVMDNVFTGTLGVFDDLRLFAIQKAHLRAVDNADLVISTRGEILTEHPAICYVHHPVYNRYHTDIFDTPDSTLLKEIDKRLPPVAPNETLGAETTVLTNSKWMAEEISKLYNVSPEVVYPPVPTDGFDPPKLGEQESAFVMAGRVAPYKHQAEAINVIERVRKEGFDIDLHIVGPIDDEDYGDLVKKKANNSPWAFYHGKLPRDEYVELLHECRYGIHGMWKEHFGITIAEMVAAGTLPFIPDDGGQVEIVNEQNELTFGSWDGAVESITNVLEGTYKEKELRERLPNIEDCFGTDRFQREIQNSVVNICFP